MLYQSACRHARQISSCSLAHPFSKTDLEATLSERRKMWLEMLGLWPLPKRTPLKPVITGSLKRDGYIIDKLHFQSMPGAYVPGNLYRPAKNDRRLPAVLYLCGHSIGKACPRYQANTRWFAQHGYVALVLDTIEQGEAQGEHHGTYSHGRWDWYSRGYTPAGTEVWNAMRAFDYLASRPDVDANRMGVTGISGGGAMSWFFGAADERVKCIVPVCQTGSIGQQVTDRAVDGHCDCAFWINYYRWCTPDIGALIAPRPLLIAAGTEDVLWRPYAFRDVFRRIRRQYAKLGMAENVRLVEDIAPHGYTEKIRKAIFEWFNLHLKGDARPIKDDVTGHIEPGKNLLVFNNKPPRKDTMRIIDTLLVKKALPPAVKSLSQWTAYQRNTLDALRRLTFSATRPPACSAWSAATAGRQHFAQSDRGGRYIPGKTTPGLIEFRDDGRGNEFGGNLSSYVFKTADELELRVRVIRPSNTTRIHVLAFALPESALTGHYANERPPVSEGIGTACVEVRNTASSSIGPGYLWTLRRSYPLLGQSLPERQVYDLLAGIEIIRQQSFAGPIALYGEGRAALLAIYAALLNSSISEVVLKNPPASHEDPETPEFLGILRIGDLPQNLALIYPRPITFIGKIPPAYQWTEKLYRKLGKKHLIRQIRSPHEWKPSGQ
ncbi:MAG: acetylxylan esterase [Kiritimatiellia bacterium]|nr:acetylxylan esterase [Kiritimatiellia bacterium]